MAAELAVSADLAKAKLGVAQLIAPADAEMLDAAQQLFVDAAAKTIVKRDAAKGKSSRASIVAIASAKSKSSGPIRVGR